ncbi:hypothetical protein LSH36_313g01009 [Paralvinella palmiformis]|uniref:Sulfotransferase n=1 Tax=Paralvinella palmiformis TaxID=53620 RepID=A0AAD9JGY3_9ANNE|nr:hypothetical protein LSH36_313g01009 [Paralvinella palmiformis]
MFLPLETHGAVSVKTVNEKFVVWNISRVANYGHLSRLRKYKDLEPVKWVFVLSYQRTGSTFVGRMFNDPDAVFYIFEPLDPLYSAMYGIQDGWAVPSDIFNNINGSVRSLPETEQNAITWTMERIFTCNMASLPPAILAHRFWSIFNPQMTHTQKYISCLKRENLTVSTILLNCQKFIRRRCGVRFGEKPIHNKYCREVLWGNDLATDNDHYVPSCNKYRRSLSNETLPADFKQYFQCLIDVEPTLTKCASDYLDEPCRQKKLRAIKTVRANMRSAELLLKSYHKIYLIHVYRDPRGVVRSRLKATWARGLANRLSAAYEAQLYCSTVLNDIRKRKHLENEGHSNQIKEIIYDDFVQKPLLTVLDSYHFLGKEPSMEVNRYYHGTQCHSLWNKTQCRSTKWIKTLKQENITAINSACSEFFKETNFS